MAKKELTLWDDLHYELRDAEYWVESKDWEQVKKRLSNAQDILHALEDLSHPEPEPNGRFVEPKILVRRRTNCDAISGLYRLVKALLTT